MDNTTNANQEHVPMADMLNEYNKLKSGATCHLTNDSTGVYDIVEINEAAIIGGGNGLNIIKKGLKLDKMMVQHVIYIGHFCFIAK